MDGLFTCSVFRRISMKKPEDIPFHDSALQPRSDLSDRYMLSEPRISCEECGVTHVVDECPLDEDQDIVWSGAFDGDKEADLNED
jgi:hypothetical protein